MKQEEIKALRREWARIDKKDPKALYKYFINNSHLKTSEIAIIAESGLQYVRDLKTSAGLGGKKPKHNPPIKAQRKIYTLKAPENWDPKNWDMEWLKTVACHYSVREIANAINVYYVTLFGKLKKYGIKIRSKKQSTRSKNQLCNKQWVYKHYVEQKLSHRECAKLAGVSYQTFGRWLARFEIPSRTILETRAKHPAKMWARKLFLDLSKQPTVRKVYIRSDHIHVRFKNYYWETYYTKEGMWDSEKSFCVNAKSSTCKNVPLVIPEYETDLLEENKYRAHIIIQPKQWAKASFIEKRLAIHEFARQIVTRGWIWPYHPECILEQEYQKLKTFNPKSYMPKGKLTVTEWHIGRKLIENYFDLSELWDIIRSPRWAVKTLNTMTEVDRIKFNTSNFIRFQKTTIKTQRLLSHQQFPRLISPRFYTTLFSQLGAKKVLDITPNHGSRALGCAIGDMIYVTEPHKKTEKAIELGLLDMTGLKYEQNDGSMVDLVIYDNDLRKCSVEEAFKYAGQTKKLVVYVPSRFKKKYMEIYKPKSIIPILNCRLSKIPDFYFVW